MDRPKNAPPGLVRCEILLSFVREGVRYHPGDVAPRIAYFTEGDARALSASGLVRIRGGHDAVSDRD